MDDLQKLLDIAKGTEKVTWSDKEALSKDIPTFANHYNIISGKDKVHCMLFELLYQNWSNKAATPITFHRVLKKLIDYKSTNELNYYIDLDALYIEIKDINQLIGPMLLKRASEEVKKQKKRSVEAIRSS